MGTAMTVMISMLKGYDEELEVYNGALGKTIAKMWLDDSANNNNGSLYIFFTDGTGVEIFDDGQDCCENRYITCDDDLFRVEGATLVDIEIRDGPDIEGEWGDVHETRFLYINTSYGTITAETHNEHNGYYGGFVIRVKEIK